MVLIDKDLITILAIKHQLFTNFNSIEQLDSFVEDIEEIFKQKVIGYIELEGMAKKDVVRVLSCQRG
jgi:hypothetical protein